MPEVDESMELENLETGTENVTPMKVAPYTKWRGEDKDMIESLKKAITNQVEMDLKQGFALEESLLHKAQIMGPNGFVVDTSGAPIEDWSRVSAKDMEEFINAGSSFLFFATTQSTNAGAEAVFAKYLYDDAYDVVYTGILDGTIDDKKSLSRRKTQEERWRAIAKSLYSKHYKSVLDRLDDHIRRVENIWRQRKIEDNRAWQAARGAVEK